MLKKLRRRPIYLSLDIDGIDPAYAQGPGPLSPSGSPRGMSGTSSGGSRTGSWGSMSWRYVHLRQWEHLGSRGEDDARGHGREVEGYELEEKPF